MALLLIGRPLRSREPAPTYTGASPPALGRALAVDVPPPRRIALDPLPELGVLVVLVEPPDVDVVLEEPEEPDEPDEPEEPEVGGADRTGCCSYDGGGGGGVYSRVTAAVLEVVGGGGADSVGGAVRGMA